MELIRLYPRWFTTGVLTPQPEYHTGHPTEVLTVLRGSLLHRGFLTDLFGTDYPRHTHRVRLTWVLWSYTRGIRHLIHFVGRGGVTTATALWPSANWFEREVWEMFGTRFEGHPDLRRLLTDYGFVGRPLLKDFPVTGYVEVRFSERQKRVVARPVSFTQEFRTFEFTSPWLS